jgi:2',3'-cyclic-nucleotide 2'-phosphodiesterase / 3'-nucleotidase
VTGEQVLLSQPGNWGRNLSVMDSSCRWSAGSGGHGPLAPSCATSVPEHPRSSRSSSLHDQTVAYVNSVIGTSLAEMSMAEARYRDVAALDFVNYVQTEAVRAGLVGTVHEGLPVLSIAAPFNRWPASPKARCRSATSPASTSTTTPCSRSS